MVQQNQSVCMDCQDHGERMSLKDRCKNWKDDSQILEVHIDNSMKDSQKVTLHTMKATEYPDWRQETPVLDLKDHAVFTRLR